jgi:hypothetical protein
MYATRREVGIFDVLLSIGYDQTEEAACALEARWS